MLENIVNVLDLVMSKKFGKEEIGKNGTGTRDLRVSGSPWEPRHVKCLLL